MPEMNHQSVVRGALLAAAALFPLSSALAQAPACQPVGASILPVGTVAPVASGATRTFALDLTAGQGVIVDLANLSPRPAAAEGDDEGEGRSAATAPTIRALRLCDSNGALLVPQPGEVFAKGGSASTTDDGERLRFQASRTGRYLVSVTSADAPREVLVRRRDGGTGPSPVISATLDGSQKGITSSKAPMVYSFTAPAGQWVEIKSTSEKDTLLRLAGPDRAGAYSQLAENDDSDGLNPKLRRRLAVAGTYYVQVDSLSEEPGDFELSLAKIAAPKPPPPPVALRTGAPVAGRLADGNDVRLYLMSVLAGHSYKLELTAPYDGVVAIGMPNPVEPEDGSDKPDAGYADIKSQDSGTTGTERLSFTARSNGQLMVRVKSFGIGDTDGGYTLTATDQGI
jgi:hypothetical protein